MHACIIYTGTTEGPGNLLLNYNENYVNLSWNKPYILPDTVLIEYKVTVSTERNISSFTTTDTSLSFPHSVLNLDPCPLNQSVNISVAGVNQVGVGEPATTEALIVQSQSEANCTEGRLYT